MRNIRDDSHYPIAPQHVAALKRCGPAVRIHKSREYLAKVRHHPRREIDYVDDVLSTWADPRFLHEQHLFNDSFGQFLTMARTYWNRVLADEQVDWLMANSNAARVKVYVDDARSTPEGFLRAYWPFQTYDALIEGRVDTLSLDHDLGDDDHGTGYDCLLRVEALARKVRPPKEIIIHSANPGARKRMELAIESIRRIEQQTEYSS